MPKPWIHQTDLFRPHEDPDDHWDLACVFALAAAGKADLRGVLIDYPPDWDLAKGCNPDVAAVSQLNYLHGLAAPALVGSSIPIQTRQDTQAHAPPLDRRGVEFLLRTLRDSPEPVIIHIVGSCRDVALAGNLAPELFRTKCAAIYLNAGSGEKDPPPGKKLEYNVALNAAAYGATFQIPCPIYWMPCWEAKIDQLQTEEWSTYWRFRQDEVLPALSPELQHYFAYVLGRLTRSDWLTFLRQGGPLLDGVREAAQILAEHGPKPRNMWCTGGFLHAAGYTVSTAGRIVPLPDAADPVFEFVPINVSCDPQGVTRWTPSSGLTNHWIYHVRNRSAYPTAMKTALRQLLSQGV